MTLPAVYCGFKIRLTFPTDKEYGKLLKAADGSMITLFTGRSRPRSPTRVTARPSPKT
jgi:hypothetical protein